MAEPCRPEPAHSRSDRRPTRSRRSMTARVAELERATHDITIVRLEVVEGGPLSFRAGHHLRASFGGLPERDYSIASRPDEPLIELHIRYSGSGPSTYVTHELRIDEPVRLRGPFGDTCLREACTAPIVAVAGGSGLAPIKSIVETALAKGMAQPIHLYFGARDEPDIYYEARFRALMRRHPNLAYVPVLSEPRDPTSRRTGMVTDALAADFDDLSETIAYLAGPPPMVEAAAAELRALGVPEDRILADAFIGEAERFRLEGDK